MRILKTGAPCPCCGRPIRYTDPDALRMLGILADFMGLPTAEAPEDEEEDGTVVPTGEEKL